MRRHGMQTNLNARSETEDLKLAAILVAHRQIAGTFDAGKVLLDGVDTHADSLLAKAPLT